MAGQRAPPRHLSGTDATIPESGDSRPEYGVFVSPVSSPDPRLLQTPPTIQAPRSRQSDSGYQTNISASDDETSRAQFYFSHVTECSDDDDGNVDILLDVSSDPDSLDLSKETATAAVAGCKVFGTTPGVASEPLSIPGASSFHDVHDRAIDLMTSTPPRSYDIHPLPDSSVDSTFGLGHHTSTGCLTNLPVIQQALTSTVGTPCGDLLCTGIKTTGSRLHASSHRAGLQRIRTASQSLDVTTEPASRDRSKSAPDIGVKRQLIEKQCGHELRKISDEFFEMFHQEGRKSRAKRESVTMATYSSSYPGTCSLRRGLWQAIVQSMSPASVRPSGDNQRH